MEQAKVPFFTAFCLYRIIGLAWITTLLDIWECNHILKARLWGILNYDHHSTAEIENNIWVEPLITIIRSCLEHYALHFGLSQSFVNLDNGGICWSWVLKCLGISQKCIFLSYYLQNYHLFIIITNIHFSYKSREVDHG